VIRAALALALLAAAPPAQAGGIVSLDLCADQYLALLAPERVAGLTRLARDPSISFVASLARRLPTIRADAEAILRRHPDLVLAGAWAAQPTLAALRAQGVSVRILSDPADFPAIRRQTRELASWLGVPARGEALIADMDRRLVEAPRWPNAPAALLWEPGGWTASRSGIAAATLRAAGLHPVGTGAREPLEALLAHPPALLVVEAGSPAPALATDLLSHSALAAIPRRQLPAALLICPGPWTARALSPLAPP
jgi:iron complex transport system substrate-binding protein